MNRCANRCVECMTPSACAAVGFDCGHDDTKRVESHDSTVSHELVEPWHGQAMGAESLDWGEVYSQWKGQP